LVCVGDSIIAAPRSWGELLARTEGWPVTRHSARGARSWQVLEQLPLLEGHHYAVGALTVGANDVLFDWDAERYDANLRAILKAMHSTCDRVLVQTFPRAFRRFLGSSPQRRAAVVIADGLIQTAVTNLGGTIVDGSDLSGQLLRPDRVHPSVLGQMVLADRAAEVLGLSRRPSVTVLARAGARNEHGRARYLASTARTTVRELLARRH
jgi:lysophospholipase L1-like esterase